MFILNGTERKIMENNTIDSHFDGYSCMLRIKGIPFFVTCKNFHELQKIWCEINNAKTSNLVLNHNAKKTYITIFNQQDMK